MAKTLEQNINQAISDFASIKDKIVEKGVDVPAGTPTRDYAAKVDGVYDAGAQEICDVVNPKIVEETERLNNHVSGAAYDRAFEAGKKSEYDAFWDTYQDYGNLKDYNGMFSGGRWKETIFRPKYDIKPSRIERMFHSNRLANIKQTLESLNVKFDTSECITFTQAFQGSSTAELPRIDLTNAITDVSMSYSFQGGKFLELHLIVSEATRYSNSFNNLGLLSKFMVEGVIGQNGLNLRWSPLDKPSLTSIINALSTTTTGLTVTLRLDAVNTAFETSPGAADGSTSDEWLALAATKPNWTISLINS